MAPAESGQREHDRTDRCEAEERPYGQDRPDLERTGDTVPVRREVVKVHRRPPEQVALILRLIEQYPLAFKVGKDEFDARRKRVRAGGKLIRTPEAYRQRAIVCRECQLAGLGPCETETLTGFPQTVVYATYKKTEAK